jgi:hypothetical protein
VFACHCVVFESGSVYTHTGTLQTALRQDTMSRDELPQFSPKTLCQRIDGDSVHRRTKKLAETKHTYSDGETVRREKWRLEWILYTNGDQIEFTSIVWGDLFRALTSMRTQDDREWRSVWGNAGASSHLYPRISACVPGLKIERYTRIHWGAIATAEGGTSVSTRQMGDLGGMTITDIEKTYNHVQCGDVTFHGPEL